MVNVSEGGLLVLASDKPFEENKIYKLWMEAPLSTGVTDRFLFEARAMRVRQNPSDGSYECGFEFISSSSADFMIALIKYMEVKGSSD